MYSVIHSRTTDSSSSLAQHVLFKTRSAKLSEDWRGKTLWPQNRKCPSHFHSVVAATQACITSPLLLPVLRNYPVIENETSSENNGIKNDGSFRAWAEQGAKAVNVSERYYINVCLIPPHRTRQVSFRETRELHDCVPQAGNWCPLRGRPGSNLHADIHWQRSPRHKGRQWFSNPTPGDHCLSALALTQGRDREKLIISTYTL